MFKVLNESRRSSLRYAGRGRRLRTRTFPLGTSALMLAAVVGCGDGSDDLLRTPTPLPSATVTPSPTTETAIPTQSTTPSARVGFRIDGCVNEFPGESCGATFEAVRLEPLGLTMQPGNDGYFHFEEIPAGDYTLYVVSGCNPYGCWPALRVSLVDHDVFVYMDLRPLSTPTPTPMLS